MPFPLSFWSIWGRPNSVDTMLCSEITTPINIFEIEIAGTWDSMRGLLKCLISLIFFVYFFSSQTQERWTLEWRTFFFLFRVGYLWFRYRSTTKFSFKCSLARGLLLLECSFILSSFLFNFQEIFNINYILRLVNCNELLIENFVDMQCWRLTQLRIWSLKNWTDGYVKYMRLPFWCRNHGNNDIL